MKKILLLILSTTILFTACEKRQFKLDKDKIEDYIAENNLDAQSTDDGIYYVIVAEGTGDRPTLNDEVEVHYEGFLLDGTKFDSSIDRGMTATFPLRAVIEGWQLGIPLFREGGSGTLLIPSKYAYGKNAPAGSVIGKNEVLVFTVQLIDVL